MLMNRSGKLEVHKRELARTARRKWAAPEGPWQNEVDYEFWIDPDVVLPCVIIRNSIGALCGYVGVSADNVLYGLSEHGVEEDYILSSHMGITYSGYIFTPETDLPYWYLGFDCAHPGDYCPHVCIGGTYRNIGYVKAQIKAMAKTMAKPEKLKHSPA